MWLKTTKSEFDVIAMHLRNAGKGYEYFEGDYSQIKVKQEDLQYVPSHLISLK